MGAIGKQAAGGDELLHLRPRIGMTKHRQTKGRLGDEGVAANGLEGRASGIGRAFVVARNNHSVALRFDEDLRGAQHMAGRMQADHNLAERHPLAIGDRLRRAREMFAIAQAHDPKRLRGGEHRAMACARVIGLAMGDERPLHRPQGIDMKIACAAIEPRRREGENVVGRHGGQHRRFSSMF